MNFSDIVDGTAIFVDANIFVYAFVPDPQFGPPCNLLLQRIERREVSGWTSSHVLSDVAHRLMSIEACAAFAWPYAGIGRRMKRHPKEIAQLTRFRQALQTISDIGVQVLTVDAGHVATAAGLSQQFGIMSNDALILAVMQDASLTQLASHDSDFDRVVWISRFGLT